MLPPSRGVKMLKKKTRAEVNLNELFLAQNNEKCMVLKILAGGL